MQIMRNPAQRFGLMFAILVAVVMLAPDIASAQMREFSGRLDTMTKKKMIVDNRQGDKVSFVRVDETVVEGEKEDWDKLKKKDWITVSWKMMDKPRKAYKVVVQPPKEDDE